MKLKLDLHDIHNRGTEIDKALRAIIDEAVAKKASVVEIIPGKGFRGTEEERPALPCAERHQGPVPPR